MSKVKQLYARLVNKYGALKSLCHKANLYKDGGRWHCSKCAKTTEAWTNGVRS